MIRLVVDAAEFGRSPNINAEILRAHTQGIVTSVSVIGNAPAFAQAVAELARVPRLGAGLALALVNGDPVAPRSSVPSLLDAAGQLRRQPRHFAVDWVRGRIDSGQVEIEFEAQLARAFEAALPIDHLCTVGHLGFLPAVGEVIERLARRHRIEGIRTDVETPTLSWVADPVRGIEMGVLHGLAWLTRRRLGLLRHGPQSWGYMESGRLDEIRILETLGRMGAGAHELICNPATRDNFASERAADLSALCSPRIQAAVVQREIVLCRWRDLF